MSPQRTEWTLTRVYKLEAFDDRVDVLTETRTRVGTWRVTYGLRDANGAPFDSDGEEGLLPQELHTLSLKCMEAWTSATRPPLKDLLL